MGIGGLTLADILRAENAAGTRSSSKAVINIHLDGGPPQMELIDPKPDAPSEIRGEFGSIRTKIPGFHVTELLPRLTANAGKYVFLRSLVAADGKHDAFQCQSGFTEKDPVNVGGRPAMGSVVNKLFGKASDTAPLFLDLMQGRPFVRNSARPGFLGATHSAYRPDISHFFPLALSTGMLAELEKQSHGRSDSLALTDGLTVRSLEDRVGLLRDLDTLRREVDASGSMDELDKFTQRSTGILTSGKFADALDFAKEDPRALERYAPRIAIPEMRDTMESPKCAQKFLLARRLVEAGVRCVSLSIGDFDTHEDNFTRIRRLGIDARRETITDTTGRPHNLVDVGRPIEELI
jgi:hypothetical protein